MSFTVHFGAAAAVSLAGPGPNLQAILSASTAGDPSDVLVVPHHPITCQAELQFHGDGRLCCEHAAAPPGDGRTRRCVDHSIAILLLELARDL
jgi:hypothetical protein